MTQAYNTIVKMEKDWNMMNAQEFKRKKFLMHLGRIKYLRFKHKQNKFITHTPREKKV